MGFSSITESIHNLFSNATAQTAAKVESGVNEVENLPLFEQQDEVTGQIAQAEDPVIGASDKAEAQATTIDDAASEIDKAIKENNDAIEANKKATQENNASISSTQRTIQEYTITVGQNKGKLTNIDKEISKLESSDGTTDEDGNQIDNATKINTLKSDKKELEKSIEDAEKKLEEAKEDLEEFLEKRDELKEEETKLKEEAERLAKEKEGNEKEGTSATTEAAQTAPEVSSAAQETVDSAVSGAQQASAQAEEAREAEKAKEAKEAEEAKEAKEAKEAEEAKEAKEAEEAKETPAPEAPSTSEPAAETPAPQAPAPVVETFIPATEAPEAPALAEQDNSEAERIAQEEAERRAQEEAETQAKEEAERLEREEYERLHPRVEDMTTEEKLENADSIVADTEILKEVMNLKGVDVQDADLDQVEGASLNNAISALEEAMVTQEYSNTTGAKVSTRTDTATIKENQEAIADFTESYLTTNEVLGKIDEEYIRHEDKVTLQNAASLNKRIGDSTQYVMTREIEKQTNALDNVQAEYKQLDNNRIDNTKNDSKKLDRKTK